MALPGPPHARGGRADRAARAATTGSSTQRGRSASTSCRSVPSAAACVLARAARQPHRVPALSDRDLTGDGVEVEFFGERTTLPGGPATLALRTGATLLPAARLLSRRPRPPRGGAAADPGRTEGRLRDDIARITQALARRVRGPDPGRARAMAPDAAELAERPNDRPSDEGGSERVRVVMTSPYSLVAPGRRAGPGARARARAAPAAASTCASSRRATARRPSPASCASARASSGTPTVRSRPIAPGPR